MMRIPSHASDEAILWIVFAREPDEAETDRAAAFELFAAMSAFLGDWIAPLSVSLRVESCDPSKYYFDDAAHPPAHASWNLRRAQLEDRLFVREAGMHSQERRVDRIGTAELCALIEEAVAQPPPLETLEVTLAELLVEAAEVALPDGIELALHHGDTPIEPISIRDGQRWLVQGPDYSFAGPPASLRAANKHGATDLYVEFCWDFWRVHPAGLAQVRAAVARVLDRGRGWQISQGNLPEQT